MGRTNKSEEIEIPVNRGTGAELPFYCVSAMKLSILSLVTFGLYEPFWFYKNWVLVRAKSGRNISPFWRACFSPFFCYSFASVVNSSAESVNIVQRIRPGPIAAIYAGLLLLQRLPDPYWLICLFSFLPLIPVARQIRTVHEAIRPGFESATGWGAWSYVTLAVGGILTGLALIDTFAPTTSWEMANAAGQEAYEQAHYAEAEEYLSAALKEAENFGPEDPRLATSLNNLAALYNLQGKYTEAEPLSKRSLAIREKALGPDHPDVATSLNNLAALYRAQGRYAEAEPLYQRALAIREKVLGGRTIPRPPPASTTWRCSTTTKAAYAEAEPLSKRSLAIREKALGPDHPHVATSLNNLAVLYRNQGRYKEAEPPHQRALMIQEKALGPEHPDVAASLNNLAALYNLQGKYTEAEPPHQRALMIQEKALGPDHPDVAQSLNNLGLLYYTQGKYTEAEPLYQRALAIHGESPGDPTTPTSLPASTIWRSSTATKGATRKPSRSTRRALAIDGDALGPDHPNLATDLTSLGLLYDTQGKYTEAEPLDQRALAIYEKALGPEHPHTATALSNLGAALLHPRQVHRSRGHSTSDRWRSGRKPWAPSIPTPPRCLRTTPACSARWAAGDEAARLEARDK